MSDLAPAAADLAAELADLSGRLDRLERLEATRGLLHDYGAIVDEKDLEGVVALFTPDAVLQSPRGTFRGHDEIRQSYAGAWAEEPSRKRHFIVAPKLTWQGEEVVEATSQFHFIGRAADRSVLGWGTYVDLVDTSGPTPRFAAKTITVHLGTDLATGWAD